MTTVVASAGACNVRVRFYLWKALSNAYGWGACNRVLRAVDYQLNTCTQRPCSAAAACLASVWLCFRLAMSLQQCMYRTRVSHACIASSVQFAKLATADMIALKGALLRAKLVQLIKRIQPSY